MAEDLAVSARTCHIGDRARPRRGRALASNELMNVEPGLVLYGPERSHEAVATPFVDAGSAGLARALAVLRQLLQLDHKLWRNTLLRRLLAFSDAVAILLAVGVLSLVARDSSTTLWLI